MRIKNSKAIVTRRFLGTMRGSWDAKDEALAFIGEVPYINDANDIKDFFASDKGIWLSPLYYAGEFDHFESYIRGEYYSSNPRCGNIAALAIPGDGKYFDMWVYALDGEDGETIGSFLGTHKIPYEICN